MEIKIFNRFKEARKSQEQLEHEQSRNDYAYPFPPGTVVKEIDEEGKTPEGPSHVGPQKGAIDFIVDTGTPVLAPLDGVVDVVVDSHDKYGSTSEFADQLNYITLRHANGEYSQPAHLAQGSASVKVGDLVSTGQQIAVTGKSGWMTEPHLHFIVFRGDISVPEGYTGLKPKFVDKLPQSQPDQKQG